MEAERRDVVGFPGYQVDIRGDVWSCLKPGSYRDGCYDVYHRLKPKVDHGGYRIVVLRRNNKSHNKKISVLVLEAFVCPRPKGMHACHGIKGASVDSLDNLRWDTPKGNNQDKKEHGTWQGGEANGNSKLSETEVRDIFALRGTGVPYYRIANQFGVAKSLVMRIIKGKAWPHMFTEQALEGRRNG